VAAFVGKDRRTIEKAAAIVDAARSEPDRRDFVPRKPQDGRGAAGHSGTPD
jgi:hypothetical protein